ncbi:glutathione S-transferase C-terminal domain-containing protein [Rhodanobacter sp. L36]|uniref:glutathione S-transferase family protein n=1 Tax=Rhodanobacter sp. L36 TaxID=1747221 RepID=UPI00131B0400|nr:glutathione S-transferase C-terminal domain-containing protein [Rhodanobacter sp. L36]
MSSSDITFFHAPNSRSGGTRALLEELGASYRLHVLNLTKNDQRQPEYLAINPMGKVPAILYGKALITEQPAVFMFLADHFANAKLAPTLDDPLRGPYLRWMVYYGSCFEPALIDKAMKREPAASSTSPYGDYDTMLNTLTDQLAKGPWLLGDTFTAADVLWGTALHWTTQFQLVPDTPLIRAYIDRVQARPAMQRAAAMDAKLAAAQSS